MVFVVKDNNGKNITLICGYDLYNRFTTKRNNKIIIDFDKLKAYALINEFKITEFNTKLNIFDKDFFSDPKINSILSLENFNIYNTCGA